jgi:hypothetical protein
MAAPTSCFAMSANIDHTGGFIRRRCRAVLDSFMEKERSLNSFVNLGTVSK